jgi:hypothetical protein
VNDAPRPAHRRVLSLAVVCLLLVPALAGAALPGSQNKPFGKEGKPFQKAPSLKERVKNNPKTGTGKSGGKFRLSYAAVQDPDYREVRDIFKEAGLLEEAVQGLNETFRIPRDVEVTMRECGEANAYYESDSHRISLCYELVSYFSGVFFDGAETDEDQEEAGEAVAGATLFTLFHELGHALIDVWDLPITGREEDAVDQLATIILLEGGEDGENAALNGAASFWGEEEESDDGEDLGDSFWDEHSLGEQRFYNIVCWSYGSNPENLDYLVGDGEDDWLPTARAQQCPDEFARMAKAWDTLLSPYVRE